MLVPTETSGHLGGPYQASSLGPVVAACPSRVGSPRID